MRMPTGDNELAGRAGAGDADAFRVLLERHYDGIFRVAFRFTGNRDDAEDIAQDVCVGLADRLDAFRGEAKFTTWLYRIVVNAACDHARRRATGDRVTAEFAMVEDLKRSADADRGERMDWVWDMLSHFSEDIRETAILVLPKQLNHGEVAAILGVKESTVSWRMHHLRKGLKQMADDDR